MTYDEDTTKQMDPLTAFLIGVALGSAISFLILLLMVTISRTL